MRLHIQRGFFSLCPGSITNRCSGKMSPRSFSFLISRGQKVNISWIFVPPSELHPALRAENRKIGRKKYNQFQLPRYAHGIGKTFIITHTGKMTPRLKSSTARFRLAVLRRVIKCSFILSSDDKAKSLPNTCYLYVLEKQIVLFVYHARWKQFASWYRYQMNCWFEGSTAVQLEATALNFR